MTNKRKEILAAVSSSEIPLSAAAIHARLGTMDLATVYRGLHYLEKNDFITSFHFTCETRGGERYYFGSEAGHLHFFHCRRCHIFIPIEECGIFSVEKEVEKRYAVNIENHILHYTGCCGKCLENEEDRETVHDMNN